MRLNPRYGDDPIVRIETSLSDVGTPMLRQRARFAELLASLDEAQWAAPSRCEGWSAQDVVAHLVGVNQFWTLSINAALSGTPTRFLADFDPVATPAHMVDAVRAQSVDETLARFIESNDALTAVVEGLDAAAWSMLGEAPPGHVALRALALHALWDSWIHERDVALPLGIKTAIEADEIAGSLQYAAALGPAFLVSTGSTRSGVLGISATDPEAQFVVEIGATVVVRDGGLDASDALLSGDAIELLEALSYRAPLPTTFPATDRWMMSGLAEAFDTVV